MTTKELTAPAEPVSLPAILADLVLLQHHMNLPEPVGVRVSNVSRQALIDLATRADVDAWRAAVGGGRISEFAMADGSRVMHTNLYGADRLGWVVGLSASVPVGLPAGTVAQLEQLAAHAPQPDPLTIDEPVDPVGTEYIAASGSVWVKRDADLLSPPGVDDPGRWRTRGEVVEMQGELTRTFVPNAAAQPAAVTA